MQKWESFTTDAGLDLFLRGCDEQKKVQIFSAFAYRIRHNYAGKTARHELRGDTVQATVFSISATFRTHGHPDPIRFDGKLHQTLRRQFRGYKALDPLPTQQAPCPRSVFVHINFYMQIGCMDTATGQLVIGALFFAMRSCEYSKTPKSEEKKSEILQLRDIRFFVAEGLLIHHSDPCLLQKSVRVAITFRNQKNENKFETITQSKTSENLCPVVTWALIVQRIWSYPNTTETTTVNTVFIPSSGVYTTVSNKNIIKLLRDAVTACGPDRLGINIKHIGTHSVRTSYAMLSHLNGIPDSTIQKKGRWKSTAFLRYIRSYIDNFGGDSSKIMMGENGEFKSLLSLP